MMNSIFRFASFALAAALLACQASPQSVSTPSLIQVQSQAARYAFQKPEQFPQATLQSVLAQAQSYADTISRRRQIDFFQVHAQPVGLRLDASTYLMSFIGTAKTRADLNVELRALVHQDQVGLNLNYSGPVTRQLNAQALTPENPQSLSAGDWSFELITGLPGEGVVSTYERHMNALADYLPYRYQGQSFAFDDGPLVYALHKQGQLQGFVFMNQRNILTLGTRKYADVQSVVVISPQTNILGAYTLVAFNPKAADSQSPLEYHYFEHERFGQFVQTGALQ